MQSWCQLTLLCVSFYSDKIEEGARREGRQEAVQSTGTSFYYHKGYNSFLTFLYVVHYIVLPFTCMVKAIDYYFQVARDDDLAEQIGKDIYFDLVDHDKVRSFRVQKQMIFNQFKVMTGSQLMIIAFV